MMASGFEQLERGMAPLLLEGELLEVVQPVEPWPAVTAEEGARIALAVTDQRLLLLALDGAGLLGPQLTAVPLDEVRAITVRRSMVGGGRRITVVLDSGPLELESQAGQPAELLAVAIERERPSLSAGATRPTGTGH